MISWYLIRSNFIKFGLDFAASLGFMGDWCNEVPLGFMSFCSVHYDKNMITK